MVLVEDSPLVWYQKVVSGVVASEAAEGVEEEAVVIGVGTGKAKVRVLQSSSVTIIELLSVRPIYGIQKSMAFNAVVGDKYPQTESLGVAVWMLELSHRHVVY